MPTYRNDGTICYVVTGTDDTKEKVFPGHTVQTYDRSVPSDFTETSGLPALERTVSGENMYTGVITPKGSFNVSVSGEFSGTVSLMRSFDEFTTSKESVAYTSSDEKTYEDLDPNVQYKLGTQIGGWSSGEAIIILSK